MFSYHVLSCVVFVPQKFVLTKLIKLLSSKIFSVRNINNAVSIKLKHLFSVDFFLQISLISTNQPVGLHMFAIVFFSLFLHRSYSKAGILDIC